MQDTLYASLAAASIGCLATHPIDVYKCRLQKKVSTNMNIRTATKGIVPAFVRSNLYVGTKFYTYNVLKDNGYANGLHEKLLCGALSGGIAVIMSNPLDVVIVNKQLDNNTRKECLYNFKRSYKGSLPNVTRGVLISSSQLAVFDYVYTNLKNTRTEQRFLTACCISSVVASFISNPIDVYKTHVMSDKNMNVTTFARVVKRNGVTMLWRGLSACICRQIPLNVIRFGVFNYMLHNM
jgi:hypothetical protein